MKLITVFLFCFTTTANAITLKCEFGKDNWGIGGLIYICSATITSPANSSVIESVEGKHLSGMSNVNVNGFRLERQSLSEIPRNLADLFPNLKAIDFNSNQISMISAIHLQPFAELFWLRFYKNKIVSIDGDLFQHNTKLKNIGFSYNLLQEVGVNLLGNLPLLEKVDFRNNPCISDWAQNREGIFIVNYWLPIKCPPLAATTTSTTTETPTTTSPTTITKFTTQLPERCPLRCTLADEFDELTSKVTQLNLLTVAQSEVSDATKAEVTELRESNADLQSKVADQTKAIQSLEERIVELEKKRT
jgi:hypothetical protein